MDSQHFVVVGVLYEGWETDDLLGPISVLQRASTIATQNKGRPASVVLAGHEKKIYKSPQGPAILADKTFGEISSADVLVIPGGFSAVVEAGNKAMLDFIRRINPSSKARLVTSVCSGAAILAKTGLLDGKRATTNKAFYDMLITYGPRTNWMHKARYVADGRFLTSSGVSAGIDMAFEAVEQLWGKEVCAETARVVGYVPARSEEDPFAEVHGRQNRVLAYALSTGLHMVAPFITSTVVKQIRTQSARKRTVFVVLAEGMTDCLSLGHGVECLVADDITFHFVRIRPPQTNPTAATTTPQHLCATATGPVFECHSEMIWGSTTGSPVKPTSRDLLFIPEIVTSQLSSAAAAQSLLTGTIADLCSNRPTVLTSGPIASQLFAGTGTEQMVASFLATSRDGYAVSTEGQWLGSRSAMGVAGAVLKLIGEWYGPAKKEAVMKFVEVRIPSEKI
ncbi:hypothetical protein HDU93_009868 [Gonapodya sp. JEL0774]|nr:hypothetical protein HDU93_009868 [Gonapodya sp. JEL0774]